MHSGWVVSQKDVAWLVWRSQSVLFVRRRAQTALFREAQRAECAFPSCRNRRLRFSVRWRHVCPGEERRILAADPHEKAHSARGGRRKSAFWLRTFCGKCPRLCVLVWLSSSTASPCSDCLRSVDFLVRLAVTNLRGSLLEPCVLGLRICPMAAPSLWSTMVSMI